MQGNTNGTMEKVTTGKPLRKVVRRRPSGLQPESASWTDSFAESGKGALQAMEEGWAAIGRGTWHLFNVLPGQGTIPGFAVGLGAAMLVGVAELAAGASQPMSATECSPMENR